jgi:hypothetical protein
MEVSSGELYFRREVHQDGLLQRLSPDLAYDAEEAHQRERYDSKLGDLRKMRRLSRAITSERISVDVSASMKLLQNAKSRLLKQLALLKEQHVRKVIDEGDKMDASLMQWVLQYFAVLREELVDSRMRLKGDDEQYTALSRQSKMHRDLLSFAYRLNIETKGAVSLSAVEQNTSQYTRCRKAVMDSLGNAFASKFPGYKDINVVNVYKLEHAWLSASMQDAASAVDSAKVKGLFCNVAKKDVFSVAAYGLHCQRIDGLSAQSDPRAVFSGEGDVGTDARRRRPLFSSPWFSVESKYCKPRSAHNSPGAKVDYGQAERLADSSCFNEPRFSRSSAPAGLMNLRPEELSQGTYLALCRVLISRLRLVDEDISRENIHESVELGYDAMYSTTLEEYVLLRPAHVLPEFIMHVHLVKGQETGQEAQSSDSGRGAGVAETRPDLRSVCKVPSALEVATPSSADVRRVGVGDTMGSADHASTILLTNETQNDLAQAGGPHAARENAMWERFQRGKDGGGSGAAAVDEVAKRDAMLLKQNLLLNVEKAAESFKDKQAIMLRKYFAAARLLADGLGDGSPDA